MLSIRALTWALIGSGLSFAACSSAPAASQDERLGKQSEALGATMVCNLAQGVDLGYPVYDTTRHRTWFLFGDDFRQSGARDLLGYSDSTSPNCGSFREWAPDPLHHITLDGDYLTESRTPTGGAYDDVGDRIIAGFTTNAVNAVPTAGALGEASVATDPAAFTRLRASDGQPVLNDPTRFLVMAPAIVDLVELGDKGSLLPNGNGADNRVLLVWGTGAPYRNSAVYLAAVRFNLLHQRDRWVFFGANGNWVQSSASAVPVFPEQAPIDAPPGATGCAGDISVSFNAPFHKWMMIYKCPKQNVNGRGPAPDRTVVMRTAESPLGRWSPAAALFIPKKYGQNNPVDGDDGYSVFMHRANTRMYYAPPFFTPQRIPNDPNPAREDSPCAKNGISTCTCATSFPAGCPAPDHDPWGFDSTKGCCTDPNACCDMIFDRYAIGEGLGSGADGALYASYAVQPWSTALDGDASTPPSRQRLTYVVSTWNPYKVVLMQNEIVDRDYDNDGVDEQDDNCPGVYNPGQENCNEAAEAAWNARNAQSPDPKPPIKKLGDACDPVPCPTASADHVVQTAISYGGAACASNAWLPTLCAGREVREQIEIAPVGASPTPEIQLASQTKIPTNITVTGVDTYARFCQQNPDQGFNCSDPTKMGENQLFAFPSANAEQRVPEFIWHRVQLHSYCPPNQPGCIAALVPRDDWFTMDYGPASQRKYVWEYAADSAFWAAGGKIPPNPSTACTDTDLYGQGTCLSGRLWTHGDTTVGRDGYFGNDHAGGIHVGWHGEELVNHFFTAEPDGPFFLTRGGMQAVPVFFLRLTLPDPWPVWRFATGTVLPIVNEGGQWTAVFENGRREGLGGNFTQAATTALTTSSFTWLSAVEASPFAGNPTRPLGVALHGDANGMELRDTLVDAGGGIVDAGPPPELMSGGDGPPPYRPNALAVYSRARGRVFLGGGHDSNGSRTDLWSFELDRGMWRKVPRVEQELVEIVAMTYSYRDGTVWLVDRDERDPQAVITRLLRVEPALGSWEVVYATPPSAQPTRYDEMRSLGVDLDGNIILTASNSAPQRHRIARIAPRAGGYDVSITSCRQRALVTPALADLRGYAMFFKQDAQVDTTCTAGTQPAQGGPMERLAALPLESATLSELEEMLR